jgi:sugar phosphate isomerase/epimerase
VVAALRPVAPDCDSAENLAAKLRAARDAGLDRVDLYHYGMAPLSALDRIREALALAA